MAWKRNPSGDQRTYCLKPLVWKVEVWWQSAVDSGLSEHSKVTRLGQMSAVYLRTCQPVSWGSSFVLLDLHHPLFEDPENCKLRILALKMYPQEMDDTSKFPENALL